MKKVLALLLAMGMTASLVGCGGSGTENSSSSPRTEETSLSTEMTTVQVTEEVSSSSIEMTADDTGEGEKTLTSVLFDVTIPEGLIYEVYSCAFADETNGSIEIKFGKESTLEGRIIRQRISILMLCVCHCFLEDVNEKSPIKSSF